MGQKSKSFKQRGYNAHLRWENTRKNENECDAEHRITTAAHWLGVNLPSFFWAGWLDRSDEWRDLQEAKDE